MVEVRLVGVVTVVAVGVEFGFVMLPGDPYQSLQLVKFGIVVRKEPVRLYCHRANIQVFCSCVHLHGQSA